MFDKIASVYFIWKIYLHFSTGNSQPREPGLYQLYRHTFAPYLFCCCFCLFISHVREGGLMFCLFRIFSIFNDSVRPTIAKSTGPIFAKFPGLVELRLPMIIVKLVSRSLKGHFHGNELLLALSARLSSGDVLQMALTYSKIIVHAGHWAQAVSGVAGWAIVWLRRACV